MSAASAPLSALPASSAARVRFVLVAPSLPANIGAAARALKTMGFAQLAVVAPQDPQFKQHADAIALSTHATDVLADASVHATLTEALQGVTLAFAMSGYAREYGPPLVSLRDAAAEARGALAHPAAAVAFVFGTERSGLLNEDVERCHRCCAIPADAESGSLNLAQAVQVAAYEARLALISDSVSSPFDAERPGTVEQREGLFVHLEQALIALGYLNPAEPKNLMARLRRLFNRAEPSEAELHILRGICAAIIQRKQDRAGEKVRRSA